LLTLKRVIDMGIDNGVYPEIKKCKLMTATRRSQLEYEKKQWLENAEELVKYSNQYDINLDKCIAEPNIKNKVPMQNKERVLNAHTRHLRTVLGIRAKDPHPEQGWRKGKMRRSNAVYGH